MKKNEYVAPEMEIVEITEQCNLLGMSDGENPGGTYDGPVTDDDF